METEKKYDESLDPETNGSSTNPELNLALSHDQLARGLKSRHIQFLALGGYLLPFL